MPRITYNGGHEKNSWNVSISKSTVTGKRDQIGDVPFRTACTFVKTHTSQPMSVCSRHDLIVQADSLESLAEAMLGDKEE